MTKVILFVIAGVIALNVALLAGAMLVAVLDRRRRKRDIRELETIWHLAPRRPAVERPRVIGRPSFGPGPPAAAGWSG